MVWTEIKIRKLGIGYVLYRIWSCHYCAFSLFSLRALAISGGTTNPRRGVYCMRAAINFIGTNLMRSGNQSFVGVWSSFSEARDHRKRLWWIHWHKRHMCVFAIRVQQNYCEQHENAICCCCLILTKLDIYCELVNFPLSTSGQQQLRCGTRQYSLETCF